MTEFPHQHTAHCESGVMSTLLKYHGHDLDEAMIFGIAHALTFVWLPVVKLGGMPLVSYRIAPRGIIKNTCKALGLKLSARKFSNAKKGQDALDAALSSGKLAGLQTSVFWLPYFPPQMRFHFNALNHLVYGKDGGDYLISDPVFETVQRCAAEDLQRVGVFLQGFVGQFGENFGTQVAAELPFPYARGHCQAGFVVAEAEHMVIQRRIFAPCHRFAGSAGLFVEFGDRHFGGVGFVLPAAAGTGFVTPVARAVNDFQMSVVAFAVILRDVFDFHSFRRPFFSLLYRFQKHKAS